MPLAELLNGEFHEIGDSYVLQLSPITGVTSFVSYSDLTSGVTLSSFFIKEFSYTLNGGSLSAWQTLSDVNLAAIVVADPTDSFIFRIRYTRSGPTDTGILTWSSICLLNIQATVCLLIRTSKSNWDALYGEYKFIELNKQIIRFNNEWSIPKFAVQAYLNNDFTVPDTHIYITSVPGSPCQELDLNVLIKKLWGNYLVDFQFQIHIDLWDGIQS